MTQVVINWLHTMTGGVASLNSSLTAKCVKSECPVLSTVWCSRWLHLKLTMTQCLPFSLFIHPNWLFFVSIVVTLILSQSPTSPTATSTKQSITGSAYFLPTDKRNKTGVGGFVHHNLIADK